MTFTPNMPATGQTLGFTRPLVQDNFTNYNNVLTVNHVAPNMSGEGKHKFVEMPVQASIPTTLAGEGGLFTQTLDTNKSILYYQRDNNIAVNQPVLPMACCSFITRNTNGAATQVAGYNITSVTRVALGVYDVAFALTLPFSAGVQEYIVVYGIGLTPPNASIIAYTLSPSGTGFQISLFNGAGVKTNIDNNSNRISFSVIQ